MIALAQINLLDALAPLFADLTIPPALTHEIAPSVVRPHWIRSLVLRGTLDPRVVEADLGPGETEAIGLALELGTHVVALDERRARRVARSLGLPLVGTAGLLLAAKQDGLIPAVRPYLNVLVEAGFFLGPAVVAGVLAQAEEGT
ncbi:MAG: DUF3368 domain-containing protein [Chloroflexota bacterium]|nr:DUF3368 domain-containing protein [Chloroflexota bacterium]